MYVKRRYRIRKWKLHKLGKLNYWFLSYKDLEHHYMVYRVKLRNRIVSFVYRYMYIIWMKSYNSLLPFKGKYDKWFFWHLFIEVAAYHLILYRWLQFGVCVHGKYSSFIYFYRHMVYVYQACSKLFPQVQYVKFRVPESFSTIRRKKYPRRKRRFRRVI